MDIKKNKILLVEDVKIAQKIAAMTLNELGCEVDTADTGAQAIELVNKRLYDMILMDLGLPDIDGLTVTETIRKMEGQNRHTIIVALTAHSANEDGIDNKQNCLKAGMDNYIEKPLTFEIAARLLEKYLPK